MKPYLHSFLILICVAVAALVPRQSNAQDETATLEEPGIYTATIHHNLPPFRFEIELLEPCLADVRISGGPVGYKGQTIRADLVENHAAVFAEDVNFDGYKDIQIASAWGGHGLNTTFCWWVYDKDLKRFIRAHEFDEINRVDAKEGFLIHEWDLGGGETSYYYYRLAGRKLRLVKTIQHGLPSRFPEIFSREAEDHYDYGSPVKITQIYRGGKLVRTFYKQDNDL